MIKTMRIKSNVKTLGGNFPILCDVCGCQFHGGDIIKIEKRKALTIKEKYEYGLYVTVGIRCASH